ncbi:MAG TPA: LPXTG cell wall anchor domain-containing protein [Candidatus Saccharimonadales bacterium]|nr:LPXTG cell wall anchor domain-containing protein [Candidatus Saccharimonadales bacterium]
MVKKSLQSLVILSFLTLALITLPKNLYAAYTTTQTNQAVTANPVKECTLSFGWIPFNGQTSLSSGKWDGTYTVYLYKTYTDANHSVATTKTKDFRVEFSNLIPGQRYSSEVWLTGATVAGLQPYWTKFFSMPCSLPSASLITASSNTPTPVAAGTTTQTTTDTSTTNTTELPNTGWSLSSTLIISIILGVAGFLLYRKVKPRNPSSKLPLGNFMPIK